VQAWRDSRGFTSLANVSNDTLGIPGKLLVLECLVPEADNRALLVEVVVVFVIEVVGAELGVKSPAFVLGFGGGKDEIVDKRD